MDPDALYELTGAFDSFVPPQFYAVFHLARVLFSHQRVLDPAARGTLQAMAGSPDARERRPDPAPVAEGVPTLGGYQVQPVYRRIRSFDEIPFVDAAELALKDMTELVREAEERELRVRVPRREGAEAQAEQVTRIADGGSQGALRDDEQKLYLLLDSSYSMRNDLRHVYAKAICLWFLAEKLKSGAAPWLFFRGFAVHVTPLVRATRRDEIPRVVAAVLEADAHEKGTDIQLALMTAIEDIKRSSLLHDAQIVLVSDGLDILDTDAIRAAAGASIRLHMVKIGGDAIDPTDAELKDMAERYKVDLRRKDELQRLYVDTIVEQFQGLMDTLIEIPDLRPGDLAVPPEDAQALRTFAEARVLGRAVDGVDAEEAHKAAAFVTHAVDFLAPHADATVQASLRQVQEAVNEWIRRRLASANALRELLASKNLNLVLERNALATLKDSKAFDASSLLEGDELRVALKLWGRAGGQGLGFSIPWWRIVALLWKKVWTK